MVRFGPSGSVESFLELASDTSERTLASLAATGLRAYEFSFGRGIGISDEAAEQIRVNASEHDIAVSLHAPFFINLSRTESIAKQHTFKYILGSVMLCDAMGGNRVIFHPGTAKGMAKLEAFNRSCKNLKEYREQLCELSYEHIHLCPETAGSINQVGDYDEILHLCEADESFIPAIDFAHIHALGHGSLNTAEDISKIFDRGIEVLGRERFVNSHMHFSRVAYTPSGERAHMRFEDISYGPNPTDFVPMLKKYAVTPAVICESRGTQLHDAMLMLDMYKNC